jgi:hypothetical protein
MSKWDQFPMTVPGGGLMPHVSARLRQETVDAVFQAAGGFDRLLAFTEANEDNYKFFLQHLWGKGLPRVTNAEVSVDADGVEALLARLDAGENAKVISPDGQVGQDNDVDGGEGRG